MERESLIKTLTVSAIVFICVLLVALIINVVKLTCLNDRKAELAASIADVERQITENDDYIDYISTDDYIDQYAREYLNMTGKDEEAFTGR